MKTNTTWVYEKSDETPLALYQKMITKDKRSINSWKILAFISIAAFVAALCVMIYALNLPRTVPVLVTVTDWGEAKYVGAVSKINYEGIKVPEIAIEYQIRKFVANRFSVPNDYEVFRNNLIDCYACLTNESSMKLSSELKEQNVLKNFSKERKTVEIESVLTVSKNSYQCDFVVTTSDLAGRSKNKQRYRGVLTTVLLEPNDKDKIKNPLGIYIKAFDFTEIK